MITKNLFMFLLYLLLICSLIITLHHLPSRLSSSWMTNQVPGNNLNKIITYLLTLPPQQQMLNLIEIVYLYHNLNNSTTSRRTHLKHTLLSRIAEILEHLNCASMGKVSIKMRYNYLELFIIFFQKTKS